MGDQRMSRSIKINGLRICWNMKIFVHVGAKFSFKYIHIKNPHMKYLSMYMQNLL